MTAGVATHSLQIHKPRWARAVDHVVVVVVGVAVVGVIVGAMVIVVGDSRRRSRPVAAGGKRAGRSRSERGLLWGREGEDQSRGGGGGRSKGEGETDKEQRQGAKPGMKQQSSGETRDEQCVTTSDSQ